MQVNLINLSNEFELSAVSIVNKLTEIKKIGINEELIIANLLSSIEKVTAKFPRKDIYEILKGGFIGAEAKSFCYCMEYFFMCFLSRIIKQINNEANLTYQNLAKYRTSPSYKDYSGIEQVHRQILVGFVILIEEQCPLIKDLDEMGNEINYVILCDKIHQLFRCNMYSLVACAYLCKIEASFVLEILKVIKDIKIESIETDKIFFPYEMGPPRLHLVPERCEVYKYIVEKLLENKKIEIVDKYQKFIRQYVLCIMTWFHYFIGIGRDKPMLEGSVNNEEGLLYSWKLDIMSTPTSDGFKTDAPSSKDELYYRFSVRGYDGLKENITLEVLKESTIRIFFDRICETLFKWCIDAARIPIIDLRDRSEENMEMIYNMIFSDGIDLCLKSDVTANLSCYTWGDSSKMYKKIEKTNPKLKIISTNHKFYENTVPTFGSLTTNHNGIDVLETDTFNNISNCFKMPNLLSEESGKDKKRLYRYMPYLRPCPVTVSREKDELLDYLRTTAAANTITGGIKTLYVGPYGVYRNAALFTPSHPLYLVARHSEYNLFFSLSEFINMMKYCQSFRYNMERSCDDKHIDITLNEMLYAACKHMCGDEIVKSIFDATRV